MQAVIMGCGRTGAALATRFDAEGDQVTIMDVDDAAEGRLPTGFRGRFLTGNGVAPATLRASGIAQAEAFVAVTPNDSANIVAAKAARDTYRVPRVVALLHDPVHAEVYRQLGIVTVASVPTTVNRIIQMLHHEALSPQHTFGNGDTLLVRSAIPGYLAGRPAGEFDVPGEIKVVELSRAGHSTIPESSTTLRSGDVLSFVVASGSLGRLKGFLGGRWPE